MSGIDIAIVIISIVIIGNGFRSGFIHTFGNLVGVFVGFSVSTVFFTRFGWSSVVLFFLIALIVSGVISFGIGLVDKAYSFFTILPFLKPINKILGLLAGILEAVIALSALAIFTQLYIVADGPGDILLGSKILQAIELPVSLLIDFLPL